MISQLFCLIWTKLTTAFSASWNGMEKRIATLCRSAAMYIVIWRSQCIFEFLLHVCLFDVNFCMVLHVFVFVFMHVLLFTCFFAKINSLFFPCSVFAFKCIFLHPFSVSRSHMEFEKDKAGCNKLQNYVLLPLYLTLSLWQELMDPSLSFEFVLASLSNHCVMLGLKFPSESTCGMVYTLLNFKHPMKFKEPSILFQEYVQVKNAFKASLFRCRTSLQVIPGAYLLELPPVWQDLPMDVLDKVFGNEAPCEPKFPMNRLQSLQQSIPLRQSHRLVDTKLVSQPSTPCLARKHHVCSIQNIWWPRAAHVGVRRWTMRSVASCDAYAPRKSQWTWFFSCGKMFAACIFMFTRKSGGDDACEDRAGFLQACGSHLGQSSWSFLACFCFFVLFCFLLACIKVPVDEPRTTNTLEKCMDRLEKSLQDRADDKNKCPEKESKPAKKPKHEGQERQTNFEAEKCCEKGFEWQKCQRESFQREETHKVQDCGYA